MTQPGNLASLTSGDGNVSVSYAWNNLNQSISVLDSRLATTTYTYDKASNLLTVSYPNGVQSTLNYDELNRLTSLTTPSTGMGHLYSPLGPTGNRTRQSSRAAARSRGATTASTG